MHARRHATGAAPASNQLGGEADAGVGEQRAVKWAPTLRKRAEHAQAHGVRCVEDWRSSNLVTLDGAPTRTHVRAGAVWASRGGQVHPHCGARVASAMPVRRVARACELRVLRPGRDDLLSPLSTQQQVPDPPPCISASRPHSPRARGVEQVEREHAARQHGAGAAAQEATFDTQLWRVRRTSPAVEATAVAQANRMALLLLSSCCRRDAALNPNTQGARGGTGGARARVLAGRGTSERVDETPGRGRSCGARRSAQHQRRFVSSSGGSGR